MRLTIGSGRQPMNVIHLTLFLFITLTLSACGGGGGGAGSPSSGGNAAPNSSSSDLQSISGFNNTTSGSGGSSGGGSTQIATAAFIVSWTAPSVRENNTALSLANIAGYRVYSGTSPSAYTDIQFINDSTATSFVFNSVPAGTYYVAVTTLDTNGLEGRLSEEVQLVVTN